VVADLEPTAVGQDPPPLRASSGNGRSSARRPGQTGEAKEKRARRQRKTAGRFAALNSFVDFTMQELSRAESLTWLVLYRDTKPDGTAQTSQADLARRVGVNVGTVKRAVAGLRRRGLLTVVFRGSLRRGPSAYRVHPLPVPPEKGRAGATLLGRISRPEPGAPARPFP